MYAYIYIYVYVFVYVYVYVIRRYIYIYVCVYAYVYVNIICVYTYQLYIYVNCTIKQSIKIISFPSRSVPFIQSSSSSDSNCTKSFTSVFSLCEAEYSRCRDSCSALRLVTMQNDAKNVGNGNGRVI